MNVLQPAALLVARLERLPLSRWHLRVRMIIGSATFFDGVDIIAIGLVLPVLAPLWHLTPVEVGYVISGGFAGQMIGAIGFGLLADRIGRIPTLMITIAVFAVGGIATAFTWSFASMVAVRFVQGLALAAEVPIAATDINEIAPSKTRGRFVLLYELVFVVALIAASFAGRWAIPHWGWQSIFWIGSVPPLFILLLMRTLPESPRWLIGKGRLAEAEIVVGVIEKRIAASGKTLPPPDEPMPLPPASSGNWRELFGPTYRNRTLLVWVIWIAIGFTSWPLQTWLPTIYRTLFHVSLEEALNYAIYTSITQLAAALASILMIGIAGRRLWFAGGLAIAGIALVVLWFVGPTTAAIVFVLTTVTTFCIAGLNFGLYLYTPELYPTRLRAVGCGTALAWARAGGIVSPIVIGWGMQQGGPAEVFLGLGIIAGAAGLATFFFAVETKRRVLESVSP